MAILKIEALQKFSGIVRTNPIERIANRIRRPAVACECVGQLFRRHWRDGQYTFGSRMRQGHGCGHAAAMIADSTCKSESRNFMATRAFRSTRTDLPKMRASISAAWKILCLFQAWRRQWQPVWRSKF